MRRTLSFFFLLLLGCNRNELVATSRERSSADVSAIAKVSTTSGLVANVAPGEALPADRMIIRTANVAMIVSDTSVALEKVTAAAEAAGGYVSDSKIWRDGELLRGSVSLRIPAAQLSATLASIRKLAVRIQSEAIGSQEVTQEYVDLESQLRNLEATEIELRQLMATVRERARRASDVLEMHQHMQTIRGQIEQTKGRMRYLSQMTAFATLQADLIPDAIAKPAVKPGWQPVVVAKDAVRALVGALQSVANVAIWIGIYILPMLTMLALAAYAVWKMAGRMLRLRTHH